MYTTLDKVMCGHTLILLNDMPGYMNTHNSRHIFISVYFFCFKNYNNHAIEWTKNGILFFISFFLKV